jgi:hypothetical protein
MAVAAAAVAAVASATALTAAFHEAVIGRRIARHQHRRHYDTVHRYTLLIPSHRTPGARGAGQPAQSANHANQAGMF